MQKLLLASIAVLSLGLVGCNSNSEKLPDEAVTSPEARIKEIEGSNMPAPAKDAAIARIRSETEAAKNRKQ